MVAKEDLNSLIVESVKKAQNQRISFEEIYNNPKAKIGKNEFLFFIKPEILVKSDKIQLGKILNLIAKKIESFSFNIHNIKILSANYLDQHNIIAQHYGVINKIASNATANMSVIAKEKFKEFTGKSIDEVKVLGGSEFIEQFPHFNAYSLDFLWQNLENKKLAGGTYFETIKVDDEIVYVINGFHPRQLKHFTEVGRSIVVMTLSSDISWTEARSNFIGATNPNNANQGSLRREFLDNKEALGLAEVSQGVNGVHLSAGPIEALIELKRYNSNFANNSQIKKFSDYSFGKTLQENFKGQFDNIVNNINITVDGIATSIFDLTEEKNSDESIEILKKYL